jgi:hypothetical protein
MIHSGNAIAGNRNAKYGEAIHPKKSAWMPATGLVTSGFVMEDTFL